jgi:excisionase family DNA binding protein
MEANSTFPEYLTDEQLAAGLGISTRTVKRWMQHGEGPPFIRVGKKRRFRRAAVTKWLEARERGAPPPPKPRRAVSPKRRGR